MNLNDALAAHVQWKINLRSAIERAETLDADIIGRDDCCPLGQWIHGEGARLYHDYQEFVLCKTEHAAFHREAGYVARLINDKNFDSAKQAIGMGSPYLHASNGCGQAIINLKYAIEK
ncbi:MAG: CZB domain-containing protein [Sphingopyxis sp.]